MLGEDPRRGLDGSPYSLPDEADLRATIEELRSAESRYRTRLKKVRDGLSANGLLNEVRAYQRSREIYESNAIEGIGPGLAITHRILQNRTKSGSKGVLDTSLLEESIRGDADIVAVLGLDGARLLADQLANDLASGRPVTEMDIRSLQRVVCWGDDNAGRYKRYHVRIGGHGSHEPLTPIEAPAAMHELVVWFNAQRSMPAILEAATAHAWLTHIHPFEDGNGRTARLLANIVLLRRGLPPAIVKSSSQRLAYIDALGHSDVAGDIMPLAGLFRQTIKRYVREVENPRTLREIFDLEIRDRGDHLYDWWRDQVGYFRQILSGDLAKLGLKLSEPQVLGSTDFSLLQSRDPAGRSWYAIVSDPAAREVLLWFGFPTAPSRKHLGRGQEVPSMFLAVRQPSYSLNSYRPARPDEIEGVQEITVVPGYPTVVLISDGSAIRTMGIPEATSELTYKLMCAFKYGKLPAVRATFSASEGSTRWGTTR